MSTVDIEVEFPRTLQIPGGEEYKDDLDLHGSTECVSSLPRVPVPIYRHAVPSAPWPWMDVDIDASETNPPLPPADPGQDSEWSHYPQSLFRNWTHDQVERCGILKSTHNESCSVHKVDVFEDGSFDTIDENYTIKIEDSRAYWNHLNTSPTPNVRVRTLFFENMTVPVLQMLGTRYNIEPLFFASSVNCIPSRYQEDPKHDGDHITVVLPFIHTVKNKKPSPVRAKYFLGEPEALEEEEWLSSDDDNRKGIDIQAPFSLPEGKILFQDLLAIHMYRTSTTSTIISYHPTSKLQSTPAKRLRSVVQKTGNSVYWSRILMRSKDPTFLFLAILWYVLCEWDETFIALRRYVNILESDILHDNDIKRICKLHKLQAHFLYHQQLLEDFRLSVEFVKDTPNPAMNILASTEERIHSAELLHKEANKLISEINRMISQWKIMLERVQNIVLLALANVHLEDSRARQNQVVSRMINSTAVKQIAYLVMIFFPATFLANVFRMNVREFSPTTAETLAHYIEAAVAFKLFMWWLAIILQHTRAFRLQTSGVLRGLWSLFHSYDLTSTATRRYDHRPEPTIPRATSEVPTLQAMLYFVFEETRGDHDLR